MIRRNFSTFALIFASTIGATACLSAAGEENASQTGPSLVRGSNQEVEMPAEYIPTPFGYVSVHCLHRYRENEHLATANHHSERDKTAQGVPVCHYPRYSNRGSTIKARIESMAPSEDNDTVSSNPEFQNWQMWAEQNDLNNTPSLKEFDYQLTRVPADPTIKNNQQLYFFPAIEGKGLLGDNSNSALIVPTIGWNQFIYDTHGVHVQPGWSFALWKMDAETGSAIQYLSHDQPLYLVTDDQVSVSITHCNRNLSDCPYPGPWHVKVVTTHEAGANEADWDVSMYDEADKTGMVRAYGSVFAMSEVGQCKQLPSQPVVTVYTRLLFTSDRQKANWEPSYGQPSANVPGCAGRYLVTINPNFQGGSGAYLHLNFDYTTH